MMRLLIPIVIALVGLGGGVGAALLLRPDPVPEAEAEFDAAATPCGDVGTAESMGNLADSHGEQDHARDSEPTPAADSEYVELGDQFVVPVVENGAVQALMVMTLSVETAPGFGDDILAHGPKLRDVFLREMLNHANLGGFRGAFTSNGTMDRLRNALREAGRATMGKELRDVLILDINRQELS